MAIKTNGSGIKKVAVSAVENSDKLWKVAGQPIAELLQSPAGHELAGKTGAGSTGAGKRDESGKLGRFSARVACRAGGENQFSSQALCWLRP
jgi:hypothetical protein